MTTEESRAAATEEPVLEEQKIDVSKPRPPFRLMGRPNPSAVLCDRCKMPAGKLSIVDSLHRAFLIKANTNFLKLGDVYVHENAYVCNVGKEVTRVLGEVTASASAPETSSPASPQPETSPTR